MSLTSWAARVEEFFKARTIPAAIGVLVIAGIAALLKIYADNWLSVNVVDPFLSWVRSVRGVPMGEGVVALFVLFGIVLIAAFVETSPIGVALIRRLSRTSDAKVTPRILTAEDRIEIERFRELWNDEAVWVAIRDLALLLDKAAAYFDAQGNPFAYLLREPTARLRAAEKAVHGALGETPPSLSSCQGALRTLSSEYSLAACRLNRIRFVDPKFPDEKHGVQELQEWRIAHLAVADMFDVLNKRKAFESAGIEPVIRQADQIEFQGESSFRENVVTTRAMVIADRLALLTDEEKEFLQLFSLETLPMQHDDPATWPSRDVYRAAESLVADHVLNSSEVRSGVTRYCLPRETRRVWPLPFGWKQECIELHRDTVQGTGSSGGGSTRSR